MSENVFLLLHTPDSTNELSHRYHLAFKKAIELFIVTAFLTEWDTSLELNPRCRRFRIIIGKDFGITRKAACEKVMRWLPSRRKGQFIVADRVDGFHPKAVFWRESNGRCFAIVGSSNLTRAAFETNYEVNAIFPLSKADYANGKRWVKQIEKQSVGVSEDWLKEYKEAIPPRGRRSDKGGQVAAALVAIRLPKPVGVEKYIKKRRQSLAAYKRNETDLLRLFRQCANGEITSKQFYDELPEYWSHKIGDRLQGTGWERSGKNSNFQDLSKSLLKIHEAPEEDRDDIVVEEIDRLSDRKVPTRGAFLSEMLCLGFPGEYPVLDKPIQNYRKDIGFKEPRGASEGACFFDFARKLRFSLLQNPGHPAKNLAELDTVIWLAYKKPLSQTSGKASTGRN